MTQTEFDRFKADILLKIGGARIHEITPLLGQMQGIITLINHGYFQEKTISLLEIWFEKSKQQVIKDIYWHRRQYMMSKQKQINHYFINGD